ncbi:MAG TPA: hypothetical protein VG387_13650 [Rhizomicrobium sp.]|nr:hypothetical protein [Rhizomicrobium sp.]
MSVGYTAMVMALFFGALGAQFMSDASKTERRKLLWRRTMQIVYLALLIVLGIKFVPLAWPILEKILAWS